MFTKLGFFSAVEKHGHMVVRARVRGDLIGLRKACGLKTRLVSTPAADYPFRLLLTREEWQGVLRVIGESVDYPNFKGEIGLLPGQRSKLSAYHQIWSTMRGVQRRAERPEQGGLALYPEP